MLRAPSAVRKNRLKRKNATARASKLFLVAGVVVGGLAVQVASATGHGQLAASAPFIHTQMVAAPNATGVVTDLPDVALSLGMLFRSARSVISENQPLINDATIGDKGLTAGVVLARTKLKFKQKTGHSVDEFIAAGGLKGELLQIELDAISSVMIEAQPMINERDVGFKGFLPAYFARKVAEKFRDGCGGKADIKFTAPRKYLRNISNGPDAWESYVFAGKLNAPNYPKGKPFGQVADKDGKQAYRFLMPEYYSRSCLSCHGEPRGSRDITGGLREGGRMGDLGGAVSIAIYNYLDASVPQ